LEPFGRIPHFLHVPIDPVAEPQAFFQRLEMDVARAEAVGFQDQAIDHPDDRGVAFLRFSFAFAPPGHFDLQIVSPHVRHEGLQRFVGLAEIFGDGLVDFFHRHHHRFQVGFQQVTQGIQGFKIQGIGNGHP